MRLVTSTYHDSCVSVGGEICQRGMWWVSRFVEPQLPRKLVPLIPNRLCELIPLCDVPHDRFHHLYYRRPAVVNVEVLLR